MPTIDEIYEAEFAAARQRVDREEFRRQASAGATAEVLRDLLHQVYGAEHDITGELRAAYARHGLLEDPGPVERPAHWPDFPVLDAYRTIHGQLAVWCPHEHVWHYHGGGEGFGDGDGPRGAHCRCQHSLITRHGYDLREVGNFTAEVQAAHGRPLSWSRGCRWDSCRFDRQVKRERHRAGSAGRRAGRELADGIRARRGHAELLELVEQVLRVKVPTANPAPTKYDLPTLIRAVRAANRSAKAGQSNAKVAAIALAEAARRRGYGDGVVQAVAIATRTNGDLEGAMRGLGLVTP